MGAYEEIHFYNKDHTPGYDHRVISYVRWSEKEKLVVLSNFDAERSYNFELKVPGHIIQKWGLGDGSYTVQNMLYEESSTLEVQEGVGYISVALEPLQSFIFKLIN